MALPTINDVQAIEPILTNMLIGYMQDDMRFVASRVFPAVSVDKDSGTYYIMTKKYFFFDDLKPRAPGTDFGQLGFGVSTGTYSTVEFAGEIPLADEVRANSQIPMDLESAAIRRLAQASLIRKEVAWATDFMTTNVWGTDDTTTTNWSDFAAGDPAGDVLTAKRTVSNNTGNDPNTMVVGYIVHDALARHPDVLDRIKYTRLATLGEVEGLIGPALGIENYMVGKATYSNTNEAAAFSASAIIDDDALVCYVDGAAGVFGATAGKTFVWQPGGGAGTIYTRRADEKHANMAQHKEQWDQVKTAADLGYFFSDVVD